MVVNALDMYGFPQPAEELATKTTILITSVLQTLFENQFPGAEPRAQSSALVGRLHKDNGHKWA